MGSAESVAKVDEVAAALRVAAGLLYRTLKQAAPEEELSLAEASTLSRLERCGPATASELARLDRISPQSMGATVAALEERGWVRRSRDPEDGRRIVLAITDAGRRVVHDRRGAKTQRLAAALRDGFTGAELDQLMTAVPLLERLAEQL